jgi:N-acetylglucosamine-6-phosphate deacetylase
MDCLVEILEGKRWIHCHSYRQDEILVFLRVMEHFGIQVGTLQHVLEGYKIADEIAEHGAGASCFTDWWAYKFEVIDAIPYAGSLMHERGALVSFNSDDSDLARRMNLEAAKAVKYGNTPPEEALNFVTRYPAQQLRIDHLVGSLEKGKHADFVLWSGSPLDSRSTCLETWIEGVKYFDLYTDNERTKLRRDEKAKLLEKVKKEAGYQNESTESEEETERKWRHFFNLALEKQNEGRILHCDD